MREGPAANEQKYAEAKKRDRLVDLQFKDDLKWLLNQPQFRRWAVWLIFGLSGVNKLIWDSSSKIHLLEGRRSIGIDVLATFTRFPELYSLFESDRVMAEVEQLNRAKLKSEEDDG